MKILRKIFCLWTIAKIVWCHVVLATLYKCVYTMLLAMSPAHDGLALTTAPRPSSFPHRTTHSHIARKYRDYITTWILRAIINTRNCYVVNMRPLLYFMKIFHLIALRKCHKLSAFRNICEQRCLRMCSVTTLESVVLLAAVGRNRQPLQENTFHHPQ